MVWVRILILVVGLVLLVQNVNSAATCVEKYLDGETAGTKHEYVVGKRVTLRCDVTARDPATDTVYWKFDNDVMSQGDVVIKKYQSKFNVTLEPNKNNTGIDVYTITWYAELDDAGKYNCTCNTGGIQFPVWIKRPCNEQQHVINDTGTSVEVLNYLNSSTSLVLPVNESVNFSVALDCNCTWPAVNRIFTGVWYRTFTCIRSGLPIIPAVTGKQNTSVTPIGCYTRNSSVTYRYKNVFGSINVNFTCTEEMEGIEYGFYIDEGQSTRPAPIMEILCDGLCEPPPDCPQCPPFLLSAKFFLGSTGFIIPLVSFIGTMVMNYGHKCQQAPNEAELKHGVILSITIVVSLLCVADIVIVALMSINCPGPCLPLGVFIGSVLVMAAAFAGMIIGIVYLKRVWNKPPTSKEEETTYEGIENLSFRDTNETKT